MTELYNKYINPYLTNYSGDTKFESKIAFVTTPYGNIVYKKLFYVKFVDGKDGFFYDKNDYLIELIHFDRYSDSKSAFIEKSNNYIYDVKTSPQYYSYIKIIEDRQNPHLVGKIMILKFGKQINDIVLNKFISKNPFSKVFKVVVKLKNRFPNYEDSHFVNEDKYFFDNNLNLESELSFKTINFESFERKQKLEKINKLKDEIQEWICE